MAIKNTGLGGSDWVDGEILFAVDQNDTFDATTTNTTTHKNNHEHWELLETMTYSADATKTSGTLTAKAEYKAQLNLACTASGTASLQFNGITSNSYIRLVINGATPAVESSQPSIVVCATDSVTTLVGELIFNGVSSATANGEINVAINVSKRPGGTNGIGGALNIGNAVQVTTMTLLVNSGTLTGTIKIYGRD